MRGLNHIHGEIKIGMIGGIVFPAPALAEHSGPYLSLEPEWL